jgi:hypothetical protein
MKLVVCCSSRKLAAIAEDVFELGGGEKKTKTEN